MRGRPLSAVERGLPLNPTLYQRRSHRAPPNMIADFGLPLDGTRWEFFLWVGYLVLWRIQFFAYRNFNHETMETRIDCATPLLLFSRCLLVNAYRATRQRRISTSSRRSRQTTDSTWVKTPKGIFYRWKSNICL